MARAATALCAVMFAISVGHQFSAAALPAGSAPNPGLSFGTTSGPAATVFAMNLAAGSNTCPGDTATDGYRWNTFMVPSTVDAGTLTYNASGPIAPAGVTFAKPMYSSTNSATVNKATAPTTKVVLVNSVSYSFNALTFIPGGVPAGTYKVGVACTLSGETKSFWQGFVTFSGDPAAFTWSFAADGGGSVTTTTAGGVTTTVAPTTTTGGATTTTVAGATTTTAATTTTTVAGATTTVARATTTMVSSGGNMPSTGSSSTVPMLVWGVLLLVCGRIAILLARPIKVITSDDR